MLKKSDSWVLDSKVYVTMSWSVLNCFVLKGRKAVMRVCVIRYFLETFILSHQVVMAHAFNLNTQEA